MSKVISNNLFFHVIYVIEAYIEEDTMADGYGGGSESTILKDAKEVLKELKALDDEVDDNQGEPK